MTRYEEIAQPLEKKGIDATIKKMKDEQDDLYGSNTEFLYYFDLGCLYHYKRDFKESAANFAKAEQIYEDLYTKSVTNEAAAIVTNDNTRPYRARPFELLLMYEYQILNYLAMMDVDGALVEVKRSQIAMNALYQKDQEKVNDNGLLRYLSAIVYELDGSTDDAAISYINAVKAYKEVFAREGLSDKWQYIIAVVVQPGVEFGDADVHMYNRAEAAALCARLKDFPELMFEGHSTDYQSPTALRQMVEDGVGILKVGPALTFAAREALFALSHIEDELIDDPSQRSNYIAVLDQVMLENPKNWQKYYHGTPKEQALKRAYSYSDRSRYYMPDPRIEAAMDKLFANIRSVDIPMGLLHQYMPLQYVEVRDGRLALEPRALVKDAVRVACEDYNYAVGNIG